MGISASGPSGHQIHRRWTICHQRFEHAIAQIQSGDYFAVLGLADAHSELEVRRAFSARVTLLRLHLSTEHPRFAELYNELEEAREVLLDPDLRAQYRTANPKMAERPWPCETS